MDNRVIRTLSMYAILITNKANELIRRAALNARVDVTRLRQEVYELGRLYIRKFNKENKQKQEDDVKKS